MSEEVEPINLGNPQEMTILDFAKRVLEVTGSSSEITFVYPEDERIKDDPHVRRPDISKARRVLGWNPRVPLEEGLRHTVDYFRQKLC
jgi:dTDP-glucose 4,6-dehydratase